MDTKQQEAKPERRFYSADQCKIRVEDTDNGPVLIGAAPPFNVWSKPMFCGRFLERFAPGAFEDDDDILSTWEHNDSLLLGRTSSGTLELWEDEVAARYKVRLPDTQAGRDVAQLARRGDIAGSSFEFWVLPGGEQIERDEDDVTRVTITKARRRQVGPVARPAYPETSAMLRSVEAWAQRIEEAAKDEGLAAAARLRELALAQAEYPVLR